LDPDRGGLGLFRLKDFQVALQCSWIKRTNELKHDNWRNEINNCCEHGILFVQETDAEPLGSLLQALIFSFIRFRECFTTAENNYLQVPILGNKSFMFTVSAKKIATSVKK
jgi:hypothetical protein